MKKICAVLAILSLNTSIFAQVPQLKLADQKAQDRFESRPMKMVVDPIKYVNPFIGTGGHGHTFPGPVMPFGMVQLGPDTRPEGWDGCSGYHYSDSVIYGFSHTHLSGTGVPDYADLLVIPQCGKAITTPGYLMKGGYGARFSHKDEVAQAGFYSVKLQNPDVDVRLTTTARCGIHEYTFHQAKGKKYLVLDLGYRDKVISTSAYAEGNTHVKGKRVSMGWAREQHFYFDLETSIPFTKARWIEKKGTYVMVLEFPATTKQVKLRVGISGTDVAGASANLAAEAKHWDFDQYMRSAQDTWKRELENVQFVTADAEITTNFYTGLYHTYVHPSLWTDVDGRYRDFNQKIQQSATGDLYSVFSIWDTYRGANPLYTILQPERTSSFIDSYFQQYKNTGLLPIWTLSNNETDCMIGYHAVSVIADAKAKGISLNNEEELLLAMIQTANHDHYGKKQYATQGFISAGDEAESVSRTLEYSYDDWCIAEYARLLGKTEIEKEYRLRSANWLNIYNPESGFFQPRKGGLWLPNFRPNEVNQHFTEANAWQYSLAAPHHIAGMTAAKGGPQKMERFLDSLFWSSSEMSGREQSDITGMIGQYAHGNEPSHHMGYLYNYCGAAGKTQQMIDKILREQYSNKPDGLSGNEDCGQMSAWYVLSAMGFYPVAPGSPTYAIGRPLMDKLSVRIAGKQFAISAENNSPENKYIQMMTWNDEPYMKLYLTHEMISGGGVLKLIMGPKPNPALNAYEVDLNEQVSPDKLSTPYFDARTVVFYDSVSVTADQLPWQTGTIVYTVNGDEPTYKSPVANESIVLYETATIKARTFRTENGQVMYSPVVATEFVKYIRNKSIALTTTPANQYAGTWNQALVDGQFAGADYRGTEWQGFNGKDVEGVITFDAPTTISSIAFSFLQDTKSWIFHPKGVEVEVSEDGVNYRKLAAKKNTEVDDHKTGSFKNSFRVECAPTAVKYLRFKIQNYGPCPEWHLGAGGATWTFIDEITVE